MLLSAVPGGQNDLSCDLAEIEAAGVDLVLCLARDGELGAHARTVTKSPRSHPKPGALPARIRPHPLFRVGGVAQSR